MFPGWLQILLVVLLLILLFGRGKISDLMGDVAKGIRSFQDGLKGDPEDETPPASRIESSDEESVPPRDETRTH